jgi:hypothetical protein
MAVGLPLKTTYADGDVYSASDVNDTNGTINANVNPYTAGKNKIYNAAMAVAQRGTSITGITSNTYTLDQWCLTPDTMGTYTVTQDTTVPDAAGTGYSLKVACTTADAAPAANDRVRIIVRFEGDRVQDFCFGSADAKPITLSFWVRSSKTGTYIIEMSGGSRLISQAYTITTANTWQKVVITVPGQTAAKLATGVTSGFELYFWLGAGTTFTSGTLNTSWTASPPAGNRAVGQVNFADSNTATFFLTAVQLEIGSTATPFQTATGTIQGELAVCQRYYWRAGAETGGLFGILGTSGYTSLTTAAQVIFVTPVRMRVTPTGLDYSAFSTTRILNLGAAFTATAASLAAIVSTPDAVWVDFTSSGMTAGQFSQFSRNNNATAYIGFSAEL